MKPRNIYIYKGVELKPMHPKNPLTLETRRNRAFLTLNPLQNRKPIAKDHGLDIALFSHLGKSALIIEPNEARNGEVHGESR